MIELIDRRSSDDVMSVGVYFFVATHTLSIFLHQNVAIASLPGGKVTFYVWAITSFLACLLCLFSLAIRSLELERSGLIFLSTTILVYGLSGFMIIDRNVYPGQTTSFLAFSLFFVMLHYVMKLTRRIFERDKMSKMAERSPALRDGLIKEGEWFGGPYGDSNGNP